MFLAEFAMAVPWLRIDLFFCDLLYIGLLGFTIVKLYLQWFCLVLPWFVGFCHGFTQICNGLILFLPRCPTVLLGFTMVLLEFTMVLQWFCHLGFTIVLLSFCIYHGVALFYGDLPCLCLALRSIGI